MEPADWQRVERAFSRALTASPEERRRILATLDDREDLREVLEEMLEADRRESVLDVPVLGAEFFASMGLPLDGGCAASGGRRIGPWELVEPIAAGGMGTVWRARRADGSFEQTVAVKLVRATFHGERERLSFERERRALSRLDHPGIARLLDGGTLPDGSPYLVVEHVDGLPIDVWCRDRRLSIAGRVALVRKVCAAVHHAHRNLIVHRDVKPSNVLVTREGEPKLLDFGVAKLLGAEGERGDLGAPTQRLLTPRYASPEQLRGEPVTTSSDVYALGALLYELLVDGPLFEGTVGAGHGLTRRILEEEPRRPSERVRGAVRRQIAGDLDNVALMALRKDPERRYASADQLAADLGRHERGQPVIARADTLGYRLSKLVRRNRAASAAAAVALAAVIGGAVAVRREASRAAHAAEVSADTAQRLARFVSAVGLWEPEADDQRLLGSWTSSGRDPAEALALADSLSDLLDEEVLAKRTRLDLVRALTSVYLSLGATARQVELSRRGLELLDELCEPDSVERGVGLIAMCRAERSAEGRAALAREGLALLEDALTPPDETLAWALSTTASLLPASRSEEADHLSSEALAMLDELAARGPVSAHLDLRSRMRRVGILWRLRDYDEVESLLREQVVRAREAGSGWFQAEALMSLAGLLEDRAQYAEALAAGERGLALWREVLPAGHPQLPRILMEWALLLKDTALHRRDDALLARTVPLAREVLAHREDMIDEAGRHAIEVGAAKVLCDAGHLVEARDVVRPAVDWLREWGGPRLLGEACTLEGRILIGLGRFEEAIACLEEALASYAEAQREDWETAKTRTLLGEALTNLCQLARARPLLEEGYAVVRADRGPGHYRTIQAIDRLIEHYRRSGESEVVAHWEAERGAAESARAASLNGEGGR